FAHALMRQYLFDAWHLPMQEALCDSGHEAIRDLAQKSVKEVRYHIDRSRDLIVRLGDGSDESRAKMQGALDALWPYAADLMATDAVEAALADQGVLPGLDRVRKAFDAETAATLDRATLTIPENGHARTGGRTGIHTETMGYILAEMQSVPRTFPDARW
ncbi:MAG: 1,2-phenylacetyl-CoA epoxidase subunit PaaC, partial [Limimaricola sp.]